MKILLDAMFLGTKNFLQSQGVEIIDVDLNSKPDTEVLKIAQNQGAAIVTEDAKLAKQCHILGIPYLLISAHKIGVLILHELENLTAWSKLSEGLES